MIIIMMMMIIIIMIIIIIINLIYIVQSNISGILRALYISHKVHTKAICTHTDIHETIVFIHIYMSTHMHTLTYVQIYIYFEGFLPDWCISTIYHA